MIVPFDPEDDLIIVNAQLWTLEGRCDPN